jgi:hypothetical protein
VDGNIPDQIILGQNQFFGINHHSARRGAETSEHFSNLDNILDVLKYAQSEGAGGLMLATHPRAQEIADAMRADDDLRDGFGVYVLLPYMAKYVRMANERGMVNMVFEMLESGSWQGKVRAGVKGGMGLLRQDPLRMLEALIDTELLPFKGLNIKAVFLHNALTDLAVGLGMAKVLHHFEAYIRENYQTEPGFCSLTSGRVTPYLDQVGIHNPLMMASFNPVGFQMSPSKETCERALREVPTRMIAMSTLAAGYVTPEGACEYLSSFPEIRSVIVGASSRKHIHEGFAMYRRVLSKGRQSVAG